MSKFKELLDNDEDFYNDVRYWFEQWFSDLDEHKQFEYYNITMSLLGYPDDLLFENTSEGINHLFDTPYEALIAQRNGDYNVGDRYFTYPDLVSYPNVPYEDYIVEMLDKMVTNSSDYRLDINSLYVDDQD